MKLEVGKSYRTRSGKKVTIATTIVRDEDGSGFRSEYTVLDSEGNAYMPNGAFHHMGWDKFKDIVDKWSDDDQYKHDDNKTVDERSEEKILEQARKYAVHINSAIDAAMAVATTIPQEYFKDWTAINTLKGQKKLQVADPLPKLTLVLKESSYIAVIHGKKIDVGCMKDLPFGIVRSALLSLTSGTQPSYTFTPENSDLSIKETKARAYREGIRWCNHRLSWADADQLLAFIEKYAK